VLRPGGWMFITTPNASRHVCAWNVIRGESPAWCRGHIRELGFHEISTFVHDHGFIRERIETPYVWQHLDYYPPELGRLAERLCPDVPRGDCIFILARKPGNS